MRTVEEDIGRPVRVEVDIETTRTKNILVSIPGGWEVDFRWVNEERPNPVLRYTLMDKDFYKVMGRQECADLVELFQRALRIFDEGGE